MQKYLQENEEVLKTLVKEIMKKCSKKQIPTTEPLTTLLVHLSILEPDKAFLSIPKEQCHLVLNELADLTIKRLSNELAPSLLTLKMQSYFTENFLMRDKIVHDYRFSISKLTEPLMKELTEKDVKEQKHFDSVYHTIAVVITLLSGLGNPAQRPVLCSSSGALASVFPINELPRFLALGRSDKERQIDELTHIVSGIRIFNYDTHQHVEGIDDLPNILAEATIAMKESLENEKATVRKTIDTLCSFLNSCYLEVVNEETGEMHIVASASNRSFHVNIDFFRDLLVCKRQMDVYISQLLIEVDYCNETVSTSVESLRHRLTQLQAAVRYRTAIPTTYIYPMFMEVSSIWCCLQDQMVLLSAYNNILQTLKNYFNEFDQKLHILESVSATISAADKTEDAQSDDSSTDDQLIDPMKLMNCQVTFSDMSINTVEETEFIGCCIVRMVDGNGILVPGISRLGIVNYGMSNYCFSSCEAAYKFDKQPETYLKQTINLLRRMPELIALLNMSDAIDRYIILKEYYEPKEEEVQTVNTETQTVLHPIESYIDRHHSWDVWELKRKAVQLADICKRKTHSTQTHKSHMRLSVATQTYPAKDKFAQTKTDNKSTMPKLQNFIFGLRGRSDNIAHTIILTRPNDEWLYEPGARLMTLVTDSSSEETVSSIKKSTNSQRHTQLMENYNNQSQPKKESFSLAKTVSTEVLFHEDKLYSSFDSLIEKEVKEYRYIEEELQNDVYSDKVIISEEKLTDIEITEDDVPRDVQVMKKEFVPSGSKEKAYETVAGEEEEEENDSKNILE